MLPKIFLVYTLVLWEIPFTLLQSGKGKGKCKGAPITGHEGPEWE
jgi:hypothetical protein